MGFSSKTANSGDCYIRRFSIKPGPSEQHTIPEVLFESGNRRTLIYIRLRDEKRWGFSDEKRHLGLRFRNGDEKVGARGEGGGKEVADDSERASERASLVAMAREQHYGHEGEQQQQQQQQGRKVRKAAAGASEK